MKLSLYIAQLSILPLLLGLASCGKGDSREAAIERNATMVVPETQLFPRTTQFGAKCKLVEDLSDEKAVKIINRTHTKPEPRNERSLQLLQANYQNPNFVLTMSRFLTAEKCTEEYATGRDTFAKSNPVEPIEDFDVEGYRYEFASIKGCMFKYGNVAANITMYEAEDEEAIIQTLIEHFESVAEEL